MNVSSRIQYIASKEKWNVHQRAFIVEQFLKNNSYVQTISELCAQFSLCSHDVVPTRSTVKRWIENFLEIASASKKKSLGEPAMVKMPENQDRGRDAVLTSPTFLGRRHAPSLWEFRRNPSTE